MLGDSPASTMLVASDLGRATAFYRDVLGLKLDPGFPGVAFFEAGEGSRIVIYEKEGGSKATHTVLGFSVKNLDQLLTELKAKGVKQDLRDLPEGADENGIVTYGSVRAAWINDTEGNILGLNEVS